MNEIRRTPWCDTKKGRTSRRITKRQKDTILQKYDEAMARNKNRDDILEKIANKYGGSTRTIERYIREAKEAQKLENNKNLQKLHIKEASALATYQHWKDLATVAGELVNLWEEYAMGHPIGGYYGYIIDDPLMIELPSGKIHCLLCHLKSEFPDFNDIDSWKSLLRIDIHQECIIKLALVAQGRPLKGTCDICQGWV